MALSHLDMDRSPRNFIPFPTAGHWPAPEHDGDAHEHDDEDDWGEGAAESADVWGGPSSESEQHSVRDWGAPSGGGWGDPPSGGAWGEAPIAPGAWGLPPEPASNGLGVYGMSKGNSKRGGVPVAQSPRTTAQAPASLHPSAAVHMTPSAAVHMAPSGWGAPHAATTAWGDPTGGWGQPPVPRPPAAKPAWANWANEVKMVNTKPAPVPNSYAYPADPVTVGGGTRQVLSNQQRSQLLSSLLAAPNQQTEGYFSQSQPQHHRQQSVPHPNHSQQGQYAHPQVQFAAEQQSTLRRAQESHARSANGHSQPGHAQQQTRPAPQYADSWTHWGRDGWGGERTSTIPEEDEEYDEDEDGEWEEDEDDEWSPSHGNQRVRFSPNVDYAQSPSSAARARPRHPPARASVTSPPRQAYQQVWTPSPISRTMKMARGGSISSVSGTVKTTVFELVPPRNGFGENTFVDSHAEALIPADRALYSRDRPAKERFRWGFNPDKDPRVGSLLRWIAAMSNGLATIGVSSIARYCCVSPLMTSL